MRFILQCTNNHVSAELIISTKIFLLYSVRYVFPLILFFRTKGLQHAFGFFILFFFCAPFVFRLFFSMFSLLVTFHMPHRIAYICICIMHGSVKCCYWVENGILWYKVVVSYSIRGIVHYYGITDIPSITPIDSMLKTLDSCYTSNIKHLVPSVLLSNMIRADGIIIIIIQWNKVTKKEISDATND